jgi:hypothetical protein
MGPVGHDLTPPASDLVHTWQLVHDHHWQVLGEVDLEPTTRTDADEQTRGGCVPGMVSVVGDMKLDGMTSVELLQNTTCTDWITRVFPERCAAFDRGAWLQVSASLPTRHAAFCIDRFEYPNERRAYPIIDVTWNESAALCKEQGKRLCTESEWTFACEGEEARPYPEGYARDPIACVIDRPWRLVDEQALSPREGHAALMEIDHLWQGEASGAHPGCRSAFGVHDLTGNVDEWTSSVSPGERPSILKGGYWGPVRARCRPSTRAHGPDFSYYQQGFRCCRGLGAG